MSDIRDAGPRLRQINDVLEENERLRGQLAWTERERDSLRVSIHNLRDYVAELNAELFAAETEPTQPRNGALSGVPDPDSRVWETQRTPHPHATPPQGSVQGEGSVRDSRNAKEPVAWVNLYPDEEFVHFDRAYVEQCSDEGEVVPLYRHPQPTLTDEEREAVKWCRDNITAMAHPSSAFAYVHAATLRKLLERLGGGR